MPEFRRLPLGAVRLVNTEGTSDKFWDVIVHPSDDNPEALPTKGWSYTAHYGRNGTAGSQQQKDFSSKQAAQRQVTRLVAAKLRRGYRDVTGTVTPDKVFEIRLGPVEKSVPVASLENTHAEQGTKRRRVIRE